jgi:hypothetical protein
MIFTASVICDGEPFHKNKYLAFGDDEAPKKQE